MLAGEQTLPIGHSLNGETPERSPLSECPLFILVLPRVFVTLLLHQRFLRVSIVIPVFPPLPGDSDRGK